LLLLEATCSASEEEHQGATRAGQGKERILVVIDGGEKQLELETLLKASGKSSHYFMIQKPCGKVPSLRLDTKSIYEWEHYWKIWLKNVTYDASFIKN
jgi:hypothetical protein